jgi:hypothetical protein
VQSSNPFVSREEVGQDDRGSTVTKDPGLKGLSQDLGGGARRDDHDAAAGLEWVPVEGAIHQGATKGGKASRADERARLGGADGGTHDALGGKSRMTKS